MNHLLKLNIFIIYDSNNKINKIVDFIIKNRRKSNKDRKQRKTFKINYWKYWINNKRKNKLCEETIIKLIEEKKNLKERTINLENEEIIETEENNKINKIRIN